MYLPTSELQTYRGQLTCQYCIMDLKDEERRIEERSKREDKKKDRYISEEQAGERCDRCGRELTTVYYYNGKHLCSTCLEEEKKDWKTVGGERPPMAMFKVRAERSRLSTIVAAVHKIANEFFGFLVRRLESEEERGRSEKERRRLEERMGKARDNLLTEKLQMPRKKITEYGPEAPDTLPARQEKQEKREKINRKGTKGKKLRFDRFSGD